MSPFTPSLPKKNGPAIVSQRTYREAVGPHGPAPPWGVGRAMTAEAGRVKFMSEVVALSMPVSQRFVVLWDVYPTTHRKEKTHIHYTLQD